MNNINDVAIASSVLLETYRSKGYDDYTQALLLANAKIENAILKTNGKWTTKKLNEIKRLIGDEIAVAYGGLFESLQDESVAIAEINYNAILGNTALTASLPRGAVKDLINSNRSIQMGENSQYGFSELLKGTKETNIRVLRNTLAGLVATGVHPYKIAKDLTFKSNSLSKGQIKSNIFTIVTDAKNQGHYEAYRKLEEKGLIKYYEHNSVLDSKTSAICIKLDGRKYYKKIDDIPNGLKPPIHANCRSQLIPRTDDNPIVNETGAEWFNRQEDSFKKKMLGNKKFKMYQNGSYKVESLPDMIGSSRSLDSYKKDLFDYVKQKNINVDLGFGDKFNEYLKDIRDEAKMVINKLPKPNSIIEDAKKAYFLSSKNILVTDKTKNTFIHEYGHSIDDKLSGYFIENKFIRQSGGDEYFSTNALKDFASMDANNLGIVAKNIRLTDYPVKERKAMMQKIKSQNEDISKKINSLYDELFEEKTLYYTKGKYKGLKKGTISQKKKEHYNYISDIIDSMTRGVFYDKYYASGHGSKYYISQRKQQAENFANLFALWSNKDSWVDAKRFFPNLTTEFENIMQEVINGKFD